MFKPFCSSARYVMNNIITKEQFLRDCAWCDKANIKHCMCRDKTLIALAQIKMAGV